MRKFLTFGFVVSTIISSAVSATEANAKPLLTKAEYANYSIQYRCAEQRYHDDLAKKESELMRIEQEFGINDDNFDEFDDLITEYERDDNLLDTISQRATNECQ